MSEGRQSAGRARTSGLRNSNSSTWNSSWRSTSHQHVEAERGTPCTIEESGPAKRLVPPLGSSPSTSRYQRWLRRTSLTLRAIWERRIGRLQKVLKPDGDAILELAHFSHGEQHSRHERVTVDRVVANRERLPHAAEYDLLVGHQSRQSHGVNRLVNVAPGGANELGRALGRPRGSVDLSVVMELDDLALRHVRRCFAGHLHHEHGADGEVRRDEDARVRLGALHLAPQGVAVESTGADHRVDARVRARADVPWSRIWGREVDDHVAVVKDAGERRVERGIGAPRELHVIRSLDRLADGRAHPARSTRYSDPNHVVE